MDKESSTHERYAMFKKVLLGNLKKRGQFESLYKNKRVILNA